MYLLAYRANETAKQTASRNTILASMTVQLINFSVPAQSGGLHFNETSKTTGTASCCVKIAVNVDRGMAYTQGVVSS